MRTKGLPPSSGDSIIQPERPHRRASDHDEAPPPPALTSAAEAGLVALPRPVVDPSTVPSSPRTPTAASLETDHSREQRPEQQQPTRSDSHTRFQVKTFMAALGTQENSNNQVEPVVTPGAVAVAPPGRQPMRDSFQSNPSAPSDPRIIAHLAPDEADVEARIAERLENQIAKKVEERLRQDMQLATVVNQSDLAVAAEVKDSSTCGLKSRTICILVIVLLLVIGGIVGGVVYAVTGGDNGQESSTLQQSSQGVVSAEPMVAPTLVPVVASPMPTKVPETSIEPVETDRPSTSEPTLTPTLTATGTPSKAPSNAPTATPVNAPTATPVNVPTQSPVEPTQAPIAPTPAPVLQLDPLVEELRVWIAPNNTDLVPFSNSSSPQSQALAWLKTDSITLSTGRSSRTVLERYVLAVLYYTTSGANWLFKYLSSTGVCTWNAGSDTLGTDLELGVYCVNDGVRVDTLTLDGNNLRGSLPWELVLLTNLEYISFDNNRLTGRIPTRIGELTQLQLFWATSNALTGTLPRTFSPSTWYIDVGDNALTGSIPWSWATRMPGLEHVLLYLNSFTGPLPTTFGQLANLTALDIVFNQLTGTIPSQLGDIFPLESFDFSGNSFTGSVDSFFCGGFEWVDLVADCDEVDCPCCTTCCYDDEAVCYSV